MIKLLYSEWEGSIPVACLACQGDRHAATRVKGLFIPSSNLVEL